MKILATIALAACLVPAAPALANDNIEYPVAAAASALPRSVATGRPVIIPPYRHVFTVRTYTTPQLPPFYNVPAYPVITPR